MSSHSPRHLRALWLAAPIMLLAFALRLYGLDAVRHEFDRGYPHGLGIAILESISDGRWQDLPVLSSSTSVALPNPPIASYFMALIAVVDRSPFSATALTAMLNALVVAMTYSLATRLFGSRVALLAALFAASSPWAIHTARGAWIQGWLELTAASAAWLILPALKEGKSRRLIAGSVVVAVLAQTYLLAFGVVAQVVAAIIVTGAPLRRLLRPAALAVAILAASAGVFGVAALASGALSDSSAGSGLDKFPDMGPSLPNPFGVRIDYTAAVRAAAMTSGRGYDVQIIKELGPDAISPLQQTLLAARYALVESLLVMGLLLAIGRARHSLAHRWMAVWLAFPVLAAMLIALVRPKVDFLEFYFLITQPAGYILAALPLAMLIEVAQTRAPSIRAGATAIAVAAPLACAFIVAPLLTHFADASLAQPLIRNQRFGTPSVDRLPTLPLRWQPAVRAIWQQHCLSLNDAVPQNWLMSMSENGHIAEAERYAALGDSHTWMVRPEGGNCVTLADGSPPILAQPYVIQLTPPTAITVFRSLPWEDERKDRANDRAPAWRALDANLYALVDPQLPVSANLGWTLVDLRGPSLSSDDSIEVTYIWRIDTVPTEPHATWAFDCYAHWLDASGNAIVAAHAPGLRGAVWQAGQLIVSTVRLPAPAERPTGDSTIRMSLYDAGQQKNAVFFSPAEPNRPILFLEHHLAPHTEIDPL